MTVMDDRLRECRDAFTGSAKAMGAFDAACGMRDAPCAIAVLSTTIGWSADRGAFTLKLVDERGAVCGVALWEDWAEFPRLVLGAPGLLMFLPDPPVSLASEATVPHAEGLWLVPDPPCFVDMLVGCPRNVDVAVPVGDGAEVVAAKWMNIRTTRRGFVLCYGHQSEWGERTAAALARNARGAAVRLACIESSTVASLRSDPLQSHRIFHLAMGMAQQTSAIPVDAQTM